jgi:hypothetical protein
MMEAPAPYGPGSTPIDLRELAILIAAWLAQVGFKQIVCGPASLKSPTFDAQWLGQVQSFCLLIQATLPLVE